MKDVRIEQWKPEYTEAFVRLNTEWIEKYFWIEDEDRKLFADPKAEIIDTGGMIYYAVTSDGVVVGCGALLKDPYGNYEIAKMAVSESMQNCGIGFRVGSAIIDHARRLGIGKLTIITNTKLHQAIHLYEKLGFHKVETESQLFERGDYFLEMPLD